MSDNPARAGASAFWVFDAATLPATAPEAAGAPAKAARGGYTAAEAAIWRDGWRAYERAAHARIMRLAPRFPSLAAELSCIPMPEPMREPDGLCERGA